MNDTAVPQTPRCVADPDSTYWLQDGDHPDGYPLTPVEAELLVTASPKVCGKLWRASQNGWSDDPAVLRGYWVRPVGTVGAGTWMPKAEADLKREQGWEGWWPGVGAWEAMEPVAPCVRAATEAGTASLVGHFAEGHTRTESECAHDVLVGLLEWLYWRDPASSGRPNDTHEFMRRVARTPGGRRALLDAAPRMSSVTNGRLALQLAADTPSRGPQIDPDDVLMLLSSWTPEMMRQEYRDFMNGGEAAWEWASRHPGRGARVLQRLNPTAEGRFGLFVEEILLADGASAVWLAACSGEWTKRQRNVRTDSRERMNPGRLLGRLGPSSRLIDLLVALTVGSGTWEGAGALWVRAIQLVQASDRLHGCDDYFQPAPEPWATRQVEAQAACDPIDKLLLLQPLWRRDEVDGAIDMAATILMRRAGVQTGAPSARPPEASR